MWQPFECEALRAQVFGLRQEVDGLQQIISQPGSGLGASATADAASSESRAKGTGVVGGQVGNGQDIYMQSPQENRDPLPLLSTPSARVRSPGLGHSALYTSSPPLFTVGGPNGSPEAAGTQGKHPWEEMQPLEALPVRRQPPTQVPIASSSLLRSEVELSHTKMRVLESNVAELMQIVRTDQGRIMLLELTVNGMQKRMLSGGIPQTEKQNDPTSVGPRWAQASPFQGPPVSHEAGVGKEIKMEQRPVSGSGLGPPIIEPCPIRIMPPNVPQFVPRPGMMMGALEQGILAESLLCQIATPQRIQPPPRCLSGARGV